MTARRQKNKADSTPEKISGDGHSTYEKKRGPFFRRDPRFSSVTDFQARVYEALCAIPRGKVTTYGLLSKAIGCRSARAIGGALKRNPFAPKVPCHRVIKSDLTIGGFSGETSGPKIRKKLALLRAEGVEFKAGRLIDHNKIFTFATQNDPAEDKADLRIFDERANEPTISFEEMQRTLKANRKI